MDTLHPTGPLGMVPSTDETAGTPLAPKAGVPATPSPYDDAALKAMVALLRRDLGEQLVSLAGGVTGFLRLHS